MLESVEHLAHLGLVHCDIKPNNFMLDDQRNVFIIDFGSVSVEGDVPPMTCQQYCPPDSVVTLAWDVFSLGVVFSEMPRLPRKEQSAAAATQDEGGCHQVPRLSRKVPRRHRRPSPPKRANQCHKCHACHAKRRRLYVKVGVFDKVVCESWRV